MTKDEKELSQIMRFAIQDYKIYKRTRNPEQLSIASMFQGNAQVMRRNLGHESAIAWNNEHPTAGNLLHTIMPKWKIDEVEDAYKELEGD